MKAYISVSLNIHKRARKANRINIIVQVRGEMLDKYVSISSINYNEQTKIMEKYSTYNSTKAIKS